jgi:hypothetical protein
MSCCDLERTGTFGIRECWEAETEKKIIVLKFSKNQYFMLTFAGIVLVLGIVRCARPDLAGPQPVQHPTASADSVARTPAAPPMAAEEADSEAVDTGRETATDVARMDDVPVPAGGYASTGSLMGQRAFIVAATPRYRDATGALVRHRVFSVPSYEQCFPDINGDQLTAAQRWGVRPVQGRSEAEKRKKDLVFVGSCPYYHIDRSRYSIPYLVPRASNLLRRISHNFLDSLAIKQIPLHTLIISSVLRTQDDVSRLRQHNGNASTQSCHCYGTTFDIAYNRYRTVEDPDGPHRRAVRNDTLKWVLSEVLRDAREAGLCYVKHERHQGCFHITVR